MEVRVFSQIIFLNRMTLVMPAICRQGEEFRATFTLSMTLISLGWICSIETPIPFQYFQILLIPGGINIP